MRAIAARYSRRGPSDAADDLAQDMAVAALEQRRAAERPEAWLERVGRNAAIDRWRGERRRAALGAAAGEPPVPAAHPLDPEAELLARERRAAVRRGLLALPRPQRRAALLRFHCQLPFDDVAARLGTETATARTRVHRALAGLRARFGGLRALVFGWPASQAAVAALVLVAAAPPRPPAAAPRPSPGVAAVRIAQAARSSSPRPARAAEATPAAEPPAAAPPAPRRGRAQGRAAAEAEPAVRRYDFENDQVEGVLARPDGTSVSVVGKSAQPSLIELRWSLQPEILKSLEEL
jgi:RNA polymerase sigma factor (sigma-70 family)